MPTVTGIQLQREALGLVICEKTGIGSQSFQRTIRNPRRNEPRREECNTGKNSHCARDPDPRDPQGFQEPKP
jgi:hypothetical protein